MLEGAEQVVKTWGVIYTEHLLSRSNESLWCSNQSQKSKVHFGEEWMAVKPDRWIRRKALEQKMIEPFTDRQGRAGGSRYGVSTYGDGSRGRGGLRTCTQVNSTT